MAGVAVDDGDTVGFGEGMKAAAEPACHPYQMSIVQLGLASREETNVPDIPIRVHSVRQESWYLRRFRCECGGNFELGRQALRPGPVDDVQVRCTLCGSTRQFKSDISEFFGKQWEIARTTVPRIDVTVEYIRELADSRDSLALEYLEEAIKFLRKKALAGDVSNGRPGGD